MPADESFSELISGRGLERYQDGLRSRFRAHRIGYSVVYGEPTSKPAMWLDFETTEAIGRVTIWESGECDMEVVDATTGEDLLREHHFFDSTDEFHSTYPKVPLLLRRILGDTLPTEA